MAGGSETAGGSDYRARKRYCRSRSVHTAAGPSTDHRDASASMGRRRARPYSLAFGRKFFNGPDCDDFEANATSRTSPRTRSTTSFTSTARFGTTSRASSSSRFGPRTLWSSSLPAGAFRPRSADEQRSYSTRSNDLVWLARNADPVPSNGGSFRTRTRSRRWRLRRSRALVSALESDVFRARRL